MSPLLRNVTIGVGGTVVVVAIYFTGVIGSNYQGAILNHLASLVQGSQTRTLVSLNAPNWGSGQPLATPAISSIASTTGGSLGNGVTLSVEVAALDRDGTTTVSAPSTFTTDANSENLNISWSPVTGAQGYAIYISTSSSPTPASYNVYWLATSTNGVPNTTFALTSTSTNVLSGSYTKEDTTAFSTRILPGSPGYFNGGSVGFGTSTPASSTPVDVNGYVRASAPGTTTACEADTAGVVFYNAANSHEWGCNGSSWQRIF